MIKNIQKPSKREALTVLVIMALFLLLTSIFIGLRSEHLLMAILYLVLFFAGLPTRKLAVALLPFAIFGISYDWMRICPNYEVNPIDVAGLYNLEKSLFGVMDNGIPRHPCEYFAAHNWAIADVFAGIFYLCWVPVPILFGLCLYFKKERKTYLRFAMVFLFVNLIGFAGYYIHPAAPLVRHQLRLRTDTEHSGQCSGLGTLRCFLRVSIFDSIYGRNANVFAAVPSLHAAYMVVALVYAIIGKCRWYVITLFSIIMAGIWGTAVYSCHHYIIDVLLGISCALAGWLIFEYVLMKIPAFRIFFDRYYTYIN